MDATVPLWVAVLVVLAAAIGSAFWVTRDRNG